MACGTVLSVRVRPTQDERPSPLVWLNLVCLDAPLVAIVWQELFARTFGIQLGVPPRAALFFTAWLIYLLDRFVDTCRIPATAPKSTRQMFCAEHRRTWMAFLLIATIADAVAISKVDHATFAAGAWLSVAAMLYLAANTFTKVWRRLPVKELAIGTLFAAGTVLAPVMQITHIASHVSIAFVLFAAVCSLNCVCIAVWERGLDEAQGRETLATIYPAIGAFVPWICAALGLASVIVTRSALAAGPVLLFTTVSTLMLALLDGLRNRIALGVRTALADLVLLTPLFWFWR
jgi:hypothetical protein